MTHSQNDRALIATYVGKYKVTLCAPALASGAETSRMTRRAIAAQRRAHAMWRAEHPILSPAMISAHSIG